MTLIPQQTSNISIIIPTLNEAEQVGNWHQLRELMENHICEIIVVDGGSSDETVSLARGLGFRTEICPAGRGRQLNHGSRVASGAILLFLHADTQLPANFDRLIQQCLSQPSTLAGAFSLSIEGATPFLRFISLCANLRSRLFQLPYGDQGIFISRDNFLRSGGFPETPIMEDFIYIRKARRTGRIRTLPQHVTTSARRWQRLGIMRTTLINQLVILGYYAGIPLRKLALLYRR